MPPPAIIAPSKRNHVRGKLLRWFDRNRRDLPWRCRQGDAYAQWVAEIMLQQTRVSTVIGYYERFLRRFPDVKALARAGHATVLKHWEGLGYYRRALHLHRAVRELVRRGETIPRTASGLRKLPGVGEYTAAAIASIAFGEPAAAVDGNVSRVIARLFGIDADPRTPPARQRIQALADALLDPLRPGDFNQAWMDLGSLVCTPRSPECPKCPLVSHCAAARTGRADEIPARDGRRRNRVREVSFVVGVFARDNRFLLRHRDLGGLWSGLWEFPNLERDGATSPLRLVRRLAEQHGVALSGSLRSAGAVRHELTHRSMTFDVFVADADRNGAAKPPGDCRWVNRVGLGKLSLSTAQRKVLHAARHILGDSAQRSAAE